MPKGHFPFHAGDWLTDERVLLMNLSEQGAYVRLLCHNWIEGAIPNDTEALARLVGVPHKVFEKFWERIAPCFVKNGHGRLTNPRMKKSIDQYATKVHAGKRGAQVRWSQQDNGTPIDVPMPTNNPKPITNTYSVHFEVAWRNYPTRKPNPKKPAAGAFEARIKEGIEPEQLIQAAKNYAAHVERERTENRYIMQAQTFFGPNERWADFAQDVGEDRPLQICGDKTLGCGGRFPESQMVRSEFARWCPRCAKQYGIRGTGRTAPVETQPKGGDSLGEIASSLLAGREESDDSRP